MKTFTSGWTMVRRACGGPLFLADGERFVLFEWLAERIRGGYRDSDGDGVPDRVEWNRDRDHDGRPDQWDRYDNRRDRHHRYERRYYGGPHYRY